MFLVVSCAKNDRELSIERIEELEKSVLMDAKSIEPQRADSLISLYKDFVKRNPGDSLAAIYLYRAADVMANRKDCLGAIALLEELIRQYPSDNHAEQGAFLKGIIYQDVCLNKEKAAESFNEFLASYPKSPLVDDAKALILFNETADELDIIRKWEAENKEN